MEFIVWFECIVKSSKCVVNSSSDTEIKQCSFTIITN